MRHSRRGVFRTGLRRGQARDGELDAALAGYLKAIVSNPNKRLSTAWKKGVEGILDAYLGEVPESFTYKGKTYTPKSYAESLPVKIDDYVAVTSFSHHPFYTRFALEVPDNWLCGQFYNVPMEEMKAIVDNALEKRLPRGMGCRRVGRWLQMEGRVCQHAKRQELYRHGRNGTFTLGQALRQGA